MVPLPWKPKDVSKLVASANVPARPPVETVTATCPNTPPSRLKIGVRARTMSGDPNNLNSEPSRPSKHPSSKKLALIPNNTTLTILDGPKCMDDILWWKVTYQGMTGWTGEGTGKDYWMEPAP